MAWINASSWSFGLVQGENDGELFGDGCADVAVLSSPRMSIVPQLPPVLRKWGNGSFSVSHTPVSVTPFDTFSRHNYGSNTNPPILRVGPALHLIMDFTDADTPSSAVCGA